jgi:hypothetical protein
VIKSIIFIKEEGENSFQLKKGVGKTKKKKASIFDDSTPTSERPRESDSSDMYSTEAMERLKAENKTQFVVVPLSRTDQALLEEDELLMQRLDATAVVDSNNGPTPSAMDISDPFSSHSQVEIIDGATMEEENEDDDSLFRSKQVEAARALRARLKHGDHAVDGETSMDHLEQAMEQRCTKFTKKGKISRHNRMQVDEEDEDGSSDSDSDKKDVERTQQGENGHGEAIDDDVSSDGEAEERAAIGLAWTGRHHLEDATKKVKLSGMDTVREHVGAETRAEDFFGAQNDDDFEWELSLIKRSGVKRNHHNITTSSISGSSSTNTASSSSKHKGPQTRIEVPTIPDRSKEPLSEDDIMKKLETDMTQLESVSAIHQARLTSLEHAKRDHETSLSTADAAFAKANADLIYFEELKLYILDLVDCVESKLMPIGDVEERMMQARLARVRKTQFHTKAAFQEQFEYCKRISTTSSSTLLPAPPKWTSLLAQLTRKKVVPQNLEESFRFDAPQLESLDGYASDDETSPEDQEKYHEAYTSIGTAAQEVFADAMDEFCDLSVILGRISEFRAKYSFFYKQSHIGSDLPTLLSPFVRLETLPWNPLQSPNFYEWPWFGAVEQFVTSTPDSQDATSSQQPTTSLTTELATQVLLPMVKNAINYFWRPNSTPETKNLQLLLSNLRHVLPPASLGQIIQLIHTNLVHAITAFELPRDNMARSSKSPTNSEEMDSYARVAFARTLKLLHISLLWKPFFSADALRSLVWENLVNSKLLPWFRSIKKMTDCWISIRLLVATLGPLAVDPAHAAARGELEAFMKLKEEEASGYFEATEIAEQVLAHLRS